MTRKRTTFVLAVALVAIISLLSGGSHTVVAGEGGSGGRAVAHRAGGIPIGDAPPGPDARLNRIIVDDAPLRSGEPTLGVTNEGNIFYTAVQTSTRIEVVRSRDDGRTWDVVSPKFPNGRNAQLLTFDPYLWVDDAEGVDRIFTIDLTIACSYLSFSDDEGKTWITNPLACGRPVNDHQTLFSGPPAITPMVGFPHVVYYCWNDLATSSCSRSLDGGITFLPTGSPAFPGVDPNAEDPGIGDPTKPWRGQEGSCGGLHGHGHVGLDGTVYLPKGHCGQPWLAISKNEGATWESVQVAKNGVVHHEASVATDRKGNIYYTYAARDRMVYLVVSRDDGKTWMKPMMVAAPGVNETNIPSLDVGGVGKVALAYMGTTNSPGMPFPPLTGTTTNPDCFVAQLPCPTPEEYKKTTWNGYVTVTKNALAKDPVFYSTTVNDERDPLKRGICGPGRCGLDILDFIDVTIAPDGQVWSSWTDACVMVCPQGGDQDMGSDAIVGRLVGIRLR
ncbi:MAG: glycoside hydrolase [Actinomycetota bacterium]|nr:glycoside hydrolase [Actinomycetota bacterium]